MPVPVLPCIYCSKTVFSFPWYFLLQTIFWSDDSRPTVFACAVMGFLCLSFWMTSTTGRSFPSLRNTSSHRSRSYFQRMLARLCLGVWLCPKVGLCLGCVLYWLLRMNLTSNLNYIYLMFDRTFIVKKVEDDDVFYRKFHVDSTGTFMKGRKEPKPQINNRPQQIFSDKGEQPRLTNAFNKTTKVAAEVNAKPIYADKRPNFDSDVYVPKHKKHAEADPDRKPSFEKHDKKGKHKKSQREDKEEFERLFQQMSQLKEYNPKINKKDLNKKFRKTKNKFEEQPEEIQSEDEEQLETFFQPYLNEKVIEQSRKAGENKYYLGTVSINEKCKWFARIDSTELPGKLVAERNNMNRAFQDSVVYFQVIQDTDSSGEEEEEDEKEEVAAVVNEHQRVKCRIVGIKENPALETEIIGKLSVRRRGERDHYLFEPNNKRFPNFEVGKNPFEAKKYRQLYEQQYFLAKARVWTEHQKYPRCDIIKQFGEMGQIEVQCKALLQENRVFQGDFLPQTQQFLKRFTDHSTPEGQYIIPQEQYKKRADLRQDLIFTIDPKTARDFDDALSIKQLTADQQQKLGLPKTDKKVYEVGIHIADVSYFVPEESIIDSEAKKRTTSVYLVHRVVPMLPRVLCQTMCSLNPGVERLTVSVWCYIDEDGNVSEKNRYARSVIHSKARFTYEIVQGIIDGKIKPGEVPAGYGVIPTADEKVIFDRIIQLNDVARKLRENRFKAGAVTIDTPKKKFELNSRSWPIEYFVEQRTESNFLVQEFMLLANTTVADILVKNVGGAAVLRRHKFPNDMKIKKFADFTKKLGIDIQVNHDVNISKQIAQVAANTSIKSSLRKLAKYELIFLMQAAEYFLVKNKTQDEWHHYALNISSYTHFTSPIRRYPDILVHRELIKIMEHGKEAIKHIDVDGLEKVLARSNACKLAARKVSTGCEKIFMCMYLKNNEVYTKGIVTSLVSEAVNVTIPEFDIRTSIQLRNLKNLKKKELTEIEGKKFLKIQYESKKLAYTFVVRETNEICVWLGATKGFPVDYNVRFAFPDHRDTTKMVCLD